MRPADEICLKKKTAPHELITDHHPITLKHAHLRDDSILMNAAKNNTPLIFSLPPPPPVDPTALACGVCGEDVGVRSTPTVHWKKKMSEPHARRRQPPFPQSVHKQTG